MMGTMDVMALSTSEVEVMAKPTRHRYSAEYKVRILREADVGTGPGEIGALLRREGLYSSNLTAWRKQREKGELEGLSQNCIPNYSDYRSKYEQEHERRKAIVAIVYEAVWLRC